MCANTVFKYTSIIILLTFISDSTYVTHIIYLNETILLIYYISHILRRYCATTILSVCHLLAKLSYNFFYSSLLLTVLVRVQVYLIGIKYLSQLWRYGFILAAAYHLLSLFNLLQKDFGSWHVSLFEFSVNNLKNWTFKLLF